jgi:hypothetical protein
VPADPTTVETLNIANLKTIAEAGAFSYALAMQNSVANQQAMNQIQQAGVAAMVKRLVEVDVNEAAGIAPLLQQLAKVAQTTPPPTG